MPSLADEKVCDANPKFRMSEPEASMSMDANPKFRGSEPEASTSMDANPSLE